MKIDENLLNEQIEREHKSWLDGIRRYRKNEEKRPEATGAAQRAIGAHIAVLAEDIRQFLEEASTGRASRNATLAAYMNLLEPNVLAYITISTVFRACHSKEPKAAHETNITESIVKQILDHLRVEELMLQHPTLYKQLCSRMENSSHSHYQEVHRRFLLNHAGIGDIEWRRQDKVRLGFDLLYRCHRTGFSESIMIAIDKKKNANVVILSKQTVEWLRKANDYAAALKPIYQPMLIPPVNRIGLDEGGYLTETLKTPLVKRMYRVQREAIQSDISCLNNVLKAVNSIQATGWKINSSVFNVVAKAWEEQSPLYGLLEISQPAEQPQRPQDSDSNSEVIKQWKRKMTAWYSVQAKCNSKHYAVSMAIETARDNLDKVAIYFPHNLDWRGRIYPIPTGLNPQGNDLQKGLLLFSEGVRLGEDGRKWLALHGANCYGLGKKSLEFRMNWVEDNEQQILALGCDEEASDFWKDAKGEEPFQFLAFCYEWTKLIQWESEGKDAKDFISHLPVSIDGTCNGFQHVAALMKDEGLAQFVLTPDSTDLYTAVADKANEFLAQNASTGDSIAQRWQGKLTRKMVKPLVMTAPYGATLYGQKGDLAALLEELAEAGEDIPFPDEFTENESAFKDTMELCRVVNTALETISPGFISLSHWLIRLSKGLAENEKSTRWRSPSGFICVQGRYEPNYLKDDFEVCGVRRQPLTRIQKNVEPNLDKAYQRSITPNFIHSLDAAHLVTIVNDCKAAGVNAFAVVHDSFGTHAGLMTKMEHSVDKTFEEIYSNPSSVLCNFLTESGANKSPLPPRGSFVFRAGTNRVAAKKAPYKRNLKQSSSSHGRRRPAR